MTPFKVKLQIYQGSTFRWHASVVSGTTAAAVDLTGYTARMQARVAITDAIPVFELTTENGGITLGGTAGTIDLYLSAVATAAMSWDTAVYDLELISPTGDVIRYIAGTATLSPEVTR